MEKYNIEHKIGIHPECAVVIEFIVALDALRKMESLAFVQPTPDYEDFVRHCREGRDGHYGAGQFYDVIYGPVSGMPGVVISGSEQISFHTQEHCRSLRFKASLQARQCYRACLKADAATCCPPHHAQ
jgi:hypothetical protein